MEWVTPATDGKDWTHVLPKAADYLGDMFDYEAEDLFIEDLEGTSAG